MTEVPESGFSVTGTSPNVLEFTVIYPVLAIRSRPVSGGETNLHVNPYGSGRRTVVQPYEIALLVANEEQGFRWISPRESYLYQPGQLPEYPPVHRQPAFRYRPNSGFQEGKEMIYPVRPFSITDVEMDGFTAGKGYPVLAIDVDQYFAKSREQEEAEEIEQPQTQMLAFFLVGDDNGEFAWIAEDECRLFREDSSMTT